MAKTASNARNNGNPGGSRPYLVVAVVVAVLIAMPIAMAVGAGWFESSARRGAAGDQPRWVLPAAVKATTMDGMVVKARVALDVGDASVRRLLEQRAEQVNLLLQSAVGAHARGEILGPKGIETLSADIRDRLNDYLESETAEAVTSVAILDIFYSEP